MHQVSVTTAWSAALLLMLAACTSTPGSEEESLRDGWPFGWTEPAIQELAKGLGISFEAAKVGLLKQEVMAGIEETLVRERGDVFEKTTLDTDPYRPPTVFIRGPADDFVRRLLAEAPIEILLVDNLPFPPETVLGGWEVLDAWANQAAEMLWDDGYQAWGSGYEGVISIQVETVPWLPVGEDTVLAAVLDVLPAELHDLVKVEVLVFDAPDGADWGPMAVTVRPSDGGQVISGRLRINEHCVVVEDSQVGDTLIVWSYDFASWNEQSKSILFENEHLPQKLSVTLKDGDWVEIPGTLFSNLALGEPYYPGQEPRGMPWLWVAAPDPSCPTQALVAGSDLIRR